MNGPGDSCTKQSKSAEKDTTGHHFYMGCNATNEHIHKVCTDSDTENGLWLPSGGERRGEKDWKFGSRKGKLL